jgi:hypothetical protein
MVQIKKNAKQSSDRRTQWHIVAAGEGIDLVRRGGREDKICREASFFGGRGGRFRAMFRNAFLERGL